MGTMKHHEIPPTVRPYGRLKLVGAGLAFAVVGTTLLLSGVQVVTHWTGQPMFSWGLIAAGGLCIVLALIPASWIAKAATIDSRTHGVGKSEPRSMSAMAIFQQLNNG
jgi:hypothetical protein